MRKHVWLTVILSLVIISMLTVTCWAASTPTQLQIVRASDGSLWKMTCDGLSCSSFTSFPGNFASQPSVAWDESINRYVVFGVAGDGSIWRSTFNANGTFQNDWAVVPGNAASPIGLAGGGLYEGITESNTIGDTITIGNSCTNYGSVTIVTPQTGDIVVDADIWTKIDHTSGQEDLVLLNIGTTNSECSGGAGGYNTSAYQVDSGAATDNDHNASLHVARTFTSVAAGSHTYYINGYMHTGYNTNDRFWFGNIRAVYTPN